VRRRLRPLARRRARADEYQRSLAEGVKKLPSIPGSLGYQVMRLDGGPDGDAYVEFQVVSYWTSRATTSSWSARRRGCATTSRW